VVAEHQDPRELLVASRVRRLEGGEPPHRDPALTPVRRGYYRSAGVDLTVSEHHRLRVYATADARQGDLVFTHASAADLWGCPQLRPELAQVHVTQPGRARRTTAGVVVHRAAIPDAHVVERGGLLVASREWTAVQVAATQRLPNVLLPLDFLVAAIVRETGRSQGEVVDGLVALITPRMKGCARAERHLRLADARSGSAGESLSRGQMVLLGIPRPALQVGFPRGDRPGEDIVDFDWPDRRVFGEFDGVGKYVEPELTGGRSAGEVLWAEKERENRIRRYRPQGARWGWADAMSRPRLARILAAVGIRPDPKLSR